MVDNDREKPVRTDAAPRGGEVRLMSGEQPQGATGPVEFATVGLGWDPTRGRRWFGARRTAIDLNAAAVLLAGDDPVEVVYHQQLISADGAVRLLGDSVNGEDEGDDEIITLDLTRVRPEITAVAVVVTCYSGQTFADIDNARYRVTAGDGTVIVDRELGTDGDTGMVVGIFRRGRHGWDFHEIAAGITAAHPVEALPHLAALLH
ncbi:TerD family protein [Nocardia africana]|uniref:General stress protein 16U n=1 Tax=Nocardia africana TaxID=134964 RepID=A0A378WLU6_9NOCA|nr:TerD family protein [Nocardia africana]MCC3315448.1 TerD family protein [Nocardia africana]SUA42238.1 General stress protein 16U [Nocardia africana]